MDAVGEHWQSPIKKKKKEQDRNYFFSLYLPMPYNSKKFGLWNAFAMFKFALVIILSEAELKTCLVYIDKDVIFSGQSSTREKN